MSKMALEAAGSNQLFVAATKLLIVIIPKLSSGDAAFWKNIFDRYEAFEIQVNKKVLIGDE
jgi:hypothetical protein